MAATDYTISREDAGLLAGAAQPPADVRAHILRTHMERHGVEALVDLFAQFIGLANSASENARLRAADALATLGNVPREDAGRINLPSVTGALWGCRLAEGVDPAGLCGGCAYRPGTAANQCAATTCDAGACESDTEAFGEFMCHVEADRGEPVTRTCAGFERARGRGRGW